MRFFPYLYDLGGSSLFASRIGTHAMKAVTARRTSAALALKAGFDGSKVLLFSEIPGPKWPVVGALPTLMSYGFSRFPDYYKDMYKTYGVIVDGTIAGEPTVILYDPREFRKVFQLEGKYPKTILSQDGMWFFERASAKTGLPLSGIALEGEAWHKTRQALQKDIFNVAAAISYCLPVTNAAETVMTSLKAKVEAGEEVDFHKTMVHAVADVFTAAMFGKSAGVSDGSASEESQVWIKGAMEQINIMTQLLLQPHLKLWPEASSTYRAYESVSMKMHETTVKLVGDCLEAYKDFEGPDEDLPYVVRASRQNLIEPEKFRSEVHGIALAGVDTTYHVLLWNMLKLASFPEAQQRLREEVHEVLGPSAHFTRDKLSQMPYLKAVMRETHRHTPPGPLFTMRFLEQDVTLCGYNVPAGTRIIMSIEGLQNDPAIVDNPHLYQPERFLPDAVEQRKSDPLKSLLDHKFLGTPFGFGARMCLGARLADMEIMTLMAKFVANFELELPPGQSWDEKMVTMKSPDPIPRVNFIPRS